MNVDATRRGGIGFWVILTILFIGLKIGNIINWSWWWVLSPIWLPATVVIGVLVGILCMSMCVRVNK